MTQQGDAVAGELATEKVGIKGYLDRKSVV